MAVFTATATANIGASTATVFDTAVSGNGYYGVPSTFIDPGTWGIVATLSTYAGKEMLLGNTDNSGFYTDGFTLHRDTGNILSASIGNGSKVMSPPYDATSITSDGVYHSFVGTYDGATLRLYVDGVEVGSGTATSGYTRPSDGIGIHELSAGFQYANAISLGAVICSDVMDTAGIAAWHTSVKSLNSMQAFGSGTNYVYDVGTGIPNKDGLWPSVGGGPSLSRAGAGGQVTSGLTLTWGF